MLNVNGDYECLEFYDSIDFCQAPIMLEAFLNNQLILLLEILKHRLMKIKNPLQLRDLHLAPLHDIYLLLSWLDYNPSLPLLRFLWVLYKVVLIRPWWQVGGIDELAVFCLMGHTFRLPI